MERGLVAIFAKPPRGGHAKTRLARALGPDRAAALAAAFLADTWAAATRWDRADVVLATPDPAADHGVPAPTWPQGGGDLGARLERIARRALAERPWFLALGADAPGLPTGHLDAALAALSRADAVLGPARDGGYWALGLRGCPDGLLADLPWSAPDTLTATEARLRSRGLRVGRASAWFDVDEPADLEHFRAVVPPADAPRTWAALEGA